MAEVAATGQRGKVKENLRNLLAESVTFQMAIGAWEIGVDIAAVGNITDPFVISDDEEKIAAAKLKIHRGAYAPDEVPGFEYPYALICSVGNDKSDNDATEQFVHGGDIELRLEREIPAEYADSPADAETDFENFYEAVLADMYALTKLPGYFVINSHNIIEGPTQYETVKDESVYGVRILINWGLI